MTRLLWVVGGVLTGISAMLIFGTEKIGGIGRPRKVPVREAAVKLQQAWADHRTQA